MFKLRLLRLVGILNPIFCQRNASHAHPVLLRRLLSEAAAASMRREQTIRMAGASNVWNDKTQDRCS